MYKHILIAVFFLFQISTGFSQDKPKILFKGVTANTIKISQLTDTAVKIALMPAIATNAEVHVFFDATGFTDPQVRMTTVGAALKNFKAGAVVGTRVTIDGITVKDPVTGKNVYYEGTSYKVVQD